MRTKAYKLFDATRANASMTMLTLSYVTFFTKFSK